MTRIFIVSAAACGLIALAGCESPSLQNGFNAGGGPGTTDAAMPAPGTETLDTTPPPAPSTSATTADEFDTTSEEDRAEALTVNPAPSGEQSLGTTQASLGSPADPGIWLKTPLVTELTQGRVEYQGQSINIELRPSGGEPGSGSQISLPAMRLLEVSLTSIVELTVFAG